MKIPLAGLKTPQLFGHIRVLFPDRAVGTNACTAALFGSLFGMREINNVPCGRGVAEKFT